jgi:hypothetical protein
LIHIIVPTEFMEVILLDFSAARDTDWCIALPTL